MRSSLFFVSVLLALSLQSQSKAEKKLDKLFDESAVAFSKKNNELALKKLDEAEELIQTSFDNDPRQILGLNAQRIVVAERIGDLKWLERLYEENRKLILELAGEDNNLYLENLMNRAVLQQKLANYQESERLFSTAEPLYRERHAGTLTLALFLRQYANLHFYLGQRDQAKEVFVENLNFYIGKLGEDNIQTSIERNNIGVVELEERRLTEAHALLSRAYNSRKQMGYEDESFASICFNFGLVHLELNQLDSADKLMTQSLKLWEKISGKQSANYGMTLGGMARVQQQIGNLKKAQEQYLEALEIFKQTLGERHPRYTQLLSRVARLFDESGDTKGAFEYHQKTMENVYFLIKDVFPGLSESEQANYYYSIKYLISRFFEHAIKNQTPEAIGEMYNAQLRLKGLFGRTAFNQLKRIKDELGPNAAQKYQELLTLKREYIVAIKAWHKDQLTELLPRIEEKEKQLSLQGSGIERVVNPSSNWRAVKEKLSEDEVAIEIVRTDSAYFGLILSPASQAPEMVALGNTSQLEGPALDVYRNAVKFKLNDTKSLDAFWTPFLENPSVQSASKVYMSADGVYHFVNLLGLPTINDRFLLDDIEIVRLTSTADLLEPLKNQTDESVVIFGSPKFDLGNKSEQSKVGHWSRALTGTTLTPLPGAKEEAQEIHQTLVASSLETQLFVDDQVSEEELKAVNSPGILHIATHGFFLEPKNQTITDKNILGLESLSDFEHPLLTSGLMLAGSQQTIRGETIGEEDGILSSLEASVLDLTGTKLSVLSACETGLGSIQNGEGVFGLQRALGLAGSRNLLMSLWKVDDEATKIMMTTFYEHLAGGQSIQSTLRLAQLKVREKYPHPYYWSSFVHLGRD